MTDITPFVQSFIDSFATIFRNVFDTLDSITFLGVSYLDYIISLFVLSVALPMVLTFVRSRSVTEKRVGKKRVERESDE